MDITAAELAAQVQAFLAAYPTLTWDTESNYGLPPGLLLAVGSRETNLDYETYGSGLVESGSGAYGVWQYQGPPAHQIPSKFGITVQADTAAQMLKGYLKTYSGSVVDAACAYNNPAGTASAIAGGQNPNFVTAPGPGSTVGDYGTDVNDRLQAIQTFYPGEVRSEVTTPSASSSASQSQGGPPPWQSSVPSKYVPQLGVIPPVDPNAGWTPALNPADWQWPYNVKGPSLILSVTTESCVDLTVGTIPQIQLTVVDPDFSIHDSLMPGIVQTDGDFGQLCRWRNEVFVISEVQTTDVNDVPCTIITLSSAVLAWMQTQRYVSNFPGSATQWIADRVAAYNAAIPSDLPPATFLGETTKQRGSNPVNVSRPYVQWLSYFDYAMELSEEEGFWLWETNGAVFFAEPSWISAQSSPIVVGWPGISGTRPYKLSQVDVECIGAPVHLRSQVLFTGDTLVLQLPRGVGEQMRCGQVVKTVGAGRIDLMTWVVQEVTFAMDGGATPVQVTCNENKFARGTEPGGITPPSPATDPTGQEEGKSALGGATGHTTSVTQFVTIAEGQKNAAYIYGTEEPGVAFDCSGLVQWALSMCGITVPRDAAEQYAYCQASGLTIPVETAINTYGALLFAEFGEGGPGPHHVAISLGNGTVFAAMDPAQGIGVANVGTGFFTAGAYAPGLDYSASGGGASGSGKAVP